MRKKFIWKYFSLAYKNIFILLAVILNADHLYKRNTLCLYC